MDTITRGIPTTATLAEIVQLISEQEERNCEFLDSKIAFVEQRLLNLITFKLFDDDTVPKRLTLMQVSDPPPANASKFWEGVLAVQNNQVLVVAGYRTS